MADRDERYEHSRGERAAGRGRGRDSEARLDDRTGVGPGSPGGYRASRRPRRMEDDAAYDMDNDPRYAEARSFEPPQAYHSEFAAGHAPHRPDHEISDEEYRQRRDYYRGADFGSRPRRAPERDERDYRRGAEHPAYADNQYRPFNPYDSSWGIGPSFGFGFDPFYPREDMERAPPAPPRRAGEGGRDRGAHAGKGPKNYRRSDERISEEVCDRLAQDSWLDASHVEVEVKNGEVTLNGHVHHRDDKKRAELWAESISGVDHVQNNLRVVRHKDHPDESDAAEQSVLDRQARGNA